MSDFIRKVFSLCLQNYLFFLSFQNFAHLNDLLKLLQGWHFVVSFWPCFTDHRTIAIKWYQTLHPPPPTQNIFPPTITHPHPPRIMPHIPPPTPPTQNCAPSTPTYPILPTLTQNNASLTVSHTKYGSITHI